MIAKSNSLTKGGKHRAAVCLTVTGLALALSGCTSSMDLFGSSPKVDRTISTGTVATSPPKDEKDVSDETTVRNAVTSADLAKIGTAQLPWANTATGSAGVVSQIRENRDQNRVCRAFVTTRHAFDGIAMFNGEACSAGGNDWILTAFNRQ